MGKRDGSMMLQEMKTKKETIISYSNFSLLLILLVKEIKETTKNARSREQSFFLLFILNA